MSDAPRAAHWQAVYTGKADTAVSWFEAEPAVSLALIDLIGIAPEVPVIDVGGGASRLVDRLLERGFSDVTVLDLAEAALAAARRRLGVRAAGVTWIAGDVTGWQPARQYGLWHDRAVLHFLTTAEDRAAYVARLRRALAPGGHAIIGTFAPDGPERCSGLPVVRHDAASLSALLGAAFALLDSRRHRHVTPGGAVQSFQFATFRRLPATAP